MVEIFKPASKLGMKTTACAINQNMCNFIHKVYVILHMFLTTNSDYAPVCGCSVVEIKRRSYPCKRPWRLIGL
jgi:hypothetical protein